MDDEARRILCDIIARYGVAVSEDGLQLRGLLKDLCEGRHTREINVLMLAQEQQVVAELRARAQQTPPHLLIERLSRRLHEDHGLDRSFARWAIESWAMALCLVAPLFSHLTVAADGSGDYRRIGEAVEHAASGARIVVRAGVYDESVTLDRPVTICGEGKVEEVVLRSAGASCLVVNTDQATVQGLTLRCQDSASGTSCYTIDIPQGCLVLEDCDVSSDSLACIAIHGSSAAPIIRRCRIHDGKDDGVLVYESGDGLIEDCDIYGNAGDGVAITTQGAPTVRKCRIYDGKQNGVYVYESGQGLIEDCDIYGNAYPGVGITTQGAPTVRKCRIYDGQSNGVFIFESGQGVIEDCDIYGNAYSGVEIKQLGAPTVRNCRINRNVWYACYIHSQGMGTIAACDLRENQQGAWSIAAGCQVQRSGNRE